MRKVYAKFAEETSSTNSLTGSNINISFESMVANGDTEVEFSDPFYDRFPWFRLIGRGLMFMQNLLVPCPVTQCICIVNEKGDVMGYLRVAVQPVNSK